MNAGICHAERPSPPRVVPLAASLLALSLVARVACAAEKPSLWEAMTGSVDGVCWSIGVIGSLGLLLAVLHRLTRDHRIGEKALQLKFVVVSAVLAWCGYWGVVLSVFLVAQLQTSRDVWIDVFSAVLVFCVWSAPLFAMGGAMMQRTWRRRGLINEGASARGYVLGTKPLPIHWLIPQPTKAVVYEFEAPDGVRRRGRTPVVATYRADAVAQRDWIRVAYDPANPWRHEGDIHDVRPLGGEA